MTDMDMGALKAWLRAEKKKLDTKLKYPHLYTDLKKVELRLRYTFLEEVREVLGC